MEKEIIQGIYKIENKKNGKVYIGQSKDIYKRWTQHKAMLDNGNHHSIKLQRSYNRVKDKTIFEYSILEEVNDESKLTDREDYYINKYDSLFNGYNCASADNSLNYKSKNKAKAKELQKYYYDLFKQLYIPEVIHFSTKWLDKLSNKNMYYSGNTMRKICIILKWFIDNYNLEKYDMQLRAWYDNTYQAIIIENNQIIERYSFRTIKKIYRPDVDMSGYYTKKPINELEIKLSYEDCLKKWKPVDQLTDRKKIQYDFKAAYKQNIKIDGNRAELITIVDDEKLNKVGNCESSLSREWYYYHPAETNQLRKNLTNYCKNFVEDKSNFMWKVYQELYNALNSQGYSKSYFGNVTYKKDRIYLAYLENDYDSANEEALSSLLQFIFNSGLKEGKHITVYIPSSRMRNLLINWINEQKYKEETNEETSSNI